MKTKLLLVIGLLASITSFAQLSFDTDSASITMKAETEKECKITITNSGTTPAQLEWRLLNSTMKDYGDPDGTWTLGFCDCNNCYSNDFSTVIDTNSCFDPMAVGESKVWKMLINPGTVSMRNAEWVIEIHNVTEGTYDTISYFFLEPSTSIKKITVNANVVSYPNPSDLEFVVDYKLSNINNPELVVYNLVGNKVLQTPLNSNSGVQKVNTSQMATGLYFYSIEENGTRYFTQKFNVVH